MKKKAPPKKPIEDRRRPKGTIIMIGGHEDKKNDRTILRALAKRVGSGRLVMATLASEVAEELWQEYDKLFLDLGVKRVDHLAIERREQAGSDKRLKLLEDASVIFFTGGDQLRITAKMGGTALNEKIREIYHRGGTIAGTSAGASVMSETMLVSGTGSESHKIGASLLMAPGLGFVRDMIVDQHFAQRGRMGRLLGAVAQNPGILGIGLDEDTAIIVQANSFEVIGSGAVYVADGKSVSFTNVSEEASEKTMSMFDVRIHVLGAGNTFDLATRRPDVGIHSEDAKSQQKQTSAA